MVTERSKGSKSHENKKLKDCASQRIRDISVDEAVKMRIRRMNFYQPDD